MMLSLAAFIALRDSVEPLLRDVDPKRLRATVEALVKFPNRNTNNATLDEAADVLEAEYKKIPGLQVERMRYVATKMARVPVEKTVVQIVAVLPGDDDRRIVIGGHFDTINMEKRDLNSVARGADDDASGTALALECARVMSARKWKHTLVFVAFSGEEQGLLGSAALAKRAKDEGWKIDAVLSNDIVGESRNSDGQKDDRHVRVFSEEAPIDGPSHQARELARFLEWNARGKFGGFSPTLIFRRDRFQRGGDHTSFTKLGFTAVRFTEVFEDFTHQHSERDLPEFLDYNYLANVTRLNLFTAATLASAGAPPTNVRMDPKQAHDTKLSWTGTPGVKYVVYYRDTSSPVWQAAIPVGEVSSATVKRVNKDNCLFAVGAEGGIPVEAR